MQLLSIIFIIQLINEFVLLLDDYHRGNLRWIIRHYSSIRCDMSWCNFKRLEAVGRRCRPWDERKRWRARRWWANRCGRRWPDDGSWPRRTAALMASPYSTSMILSAHSIWRGISNIFFFAILIAFKLIFIIIFFLFFLCFKWYLA